jgi:hypothetical protein
MLRAIGDGCLATISRPPCLLATYSQHARQRQRQRRPRVSPIIAIPSNASSSVPSSPAALGSSGMNLQRGGRATLDGEKGDMRPPSGVWKVYQRFDTLSSTNTFPHASPGFTIEPRSPHCAVVRSLDVRSMAVQLRSASLVDIILLV